MGNSSNSANSFSAIAKQIIRQIEQIDDTIEKLIPEKGIKKWFKENQPHIEKLVTKLPNSGFLHATAYKGAEENPLSPGLSHYPSQWYRTLTNCTKIQAILMGRTAQWLYNTDTVTLETEENLNYHQSISAKLRELEKRRALVKKYHLSPNQLIIAVNETQKLPEALRHQQTQLIQQSLEEIEKLSEEHKKDLLRTIRINSEKLKYQAGIHENPPVKNKAYIKPDQDGGASIYIRLNSYGYASFKTAIDRYLYKNEPKHYPDGTKIDDNLQTAEKLANAIICVMQQNLLKTKPLGNPKIIKLHEESKTKLGSLILVVSDKNYPAYSKRMNIPVQTLNGIKLDIVSAHQIAGEIPDKIVHFQGKQTWLEGAEKENPSRRIASYEQRLALASRHPYCAYPDCDKPALKCQANHVTPWQEGGPTTSDNLILACAKHHAQVDDTHSQYGRGHFDMDENGYPHWQQHPHQPDEPTPPPQYNRLLLEYYQNQGWQLPKIA